MPMTRNGLVVYAFKTTLIYAEAAACPKRQAAFCFFKSFSFVFSNQKGGDIYGKTYDF